MEYWLRSISPWLSSISLDAALGGDVVQDRAHIVFEISKNPKSTAFGHFEVIYHTRGLFRLLPTEDGHSADDHSKLPFLFENPTEVVTVDGKLFSKFCWAR